MRQSKRKPQVTDQFIGAVEFSSEELNEDETVSMVTQQRRSDRTRKIPAKFLNNLDMMLEDDWNKPHICQFWGTTALCRPYLCSKQVTLGFYKQATHRRPAGDEPFLYFGVRRLWLGMAQECTLLDQKWPNMAGLSTFQSGPKGTKMANLLVFLTSKDPFGPF